MEGLEAGSIFAVDYRVLRTVYTGGLSMRGGVSEWVKGGYPVIDFVPEG